MRTIAICNQKGGVGKTTTAVNLAAGLAQLGHPTLLIDMDPQANTTLSAIGYATPEFTTYDVLVNHAAIDDVSVQVIQQNNGLIFDLVPASIDLAAAEVELLSAIGGQLRLRSALSQLSYATVVIDSPPSLGLLTINTLAASTDVIIPVDAGLFALKGVNQLINTIQKVKQNLDAPQLKIAGVLATFTENTNVSKDVVETIRSQFGDLVFSTTIPKNVKLVESLARQQSIFTYEPDAAGAVAYRELVREVVNRG